MSTISQAIYSEANKLLLTSQKLDYQKILAHDEKEIAKLREALLDLNIRWDSNDSLDDYATKYKEFNTPKAASSGVETTPFDDVDPTKRKGQIIESLADDGFEERAGNVYSSFVKGRSLPFNQAPHRIGLPEFDIVVAPDFSPNPGLHGIFIGASEVTSVTLAIEDGVQADEWVIEKRKKFTSKEQMIDYVTLMSAGFDLPE